MTNNKQLLDDGTITTAYQALCNAYDADEHSYLLNLLIYVLKDKQVDDIPDPWHQLWAFYRGHFDEDHDREDLLQCMYYDISREVDEAKDPSMHLLWMHTLHQDLTPKDIAEAIDILDWLGEYHLQEVPLALDWIELIKECWEAQDAAVGDQLTSDDKNAEAGEVDDDEVENEELEGPITNYNFLEKFLERVEQPIQVVAHLPQRVRLNVRQRYTQCWEVITGHTFLVRRKVEESEIDQHIDPEVVEKAARINESFRNLHEMRQMLDCVDWSKIANIVHSDDDEDDEESDDDIFLDHLTVSFADNKSKESAPEDSKPEDTPVDACTDGVCQLKLE